MRDAFGFMFLTFLVQIFLAAVPASQWVGSELYAVVINLPIAEVLHVSQPVARIYEAELATFIFKTVFVLHRLQVIAFLVYADAAAVEVYDSCRFNLAALVHSEVITAFLNKYQSVISERLRPQQGRKH